MKLLNFIFDVDGTILDSKYQTIKSYDLLAREVLGRGLTKEEEIIAFHKTSSQTLDILGIKIDEKIITKLYGYFYEQMGQSKFFKGIKEVIEEILKKDLFIGIATNRNKNEIEFAMENNGLKEYFKDYVCKDDVKNPKPSGEMIVHYMNRHNLNPMETIYIGNAQEDHMAAIDAGVVYGLCKWGTEEFLEEEAIIFEKPSDILKLV